MITVNISHVCVPHVSFIISSSRHYNIFKKSLCLAGNYPYQSDIDGISQMTACIYRKFDVT